MATSPSTLTWTPHLRLSFGGSLGQPAVEVWSNSLRFVPASNVVPTSAQLQQIADVVAGALTTWFTSPDSIINQTAGLLYLKSTWVLPTGKQRDLVTAIHDFTNVFGPNSQATPIWEQSYCITLRTALKRGRAHSGRIYPPVSGHGPSGVSAYCSDTDAQTMAASFARFLTSAKTAIDGVISPGSETSGFAVVSPGDSTKATTPEFQYITRTVVDEVADIMHSRTNRVKRREGQTTALPFTG